MSLTVSQIKDIDIQVTPSGQEHGLVKVLPNSVPEDEMKRFKEKDREAMKQLRAHESKMVKKRYINTKKTGPAVKYERPYCRWPGDNILEYRFLYNGVYTVPQGLVDECNNNKTKKRSGLIDPKTTKELMVDIDEQPEHLFVSVD